jgi:hypothetical protein
VLWCRADGRRPAAPGRRRKRGPVLTVSLAPVFLCTVCSRAGRAPACCSGEVTVEIPESLPTASMLNQNTDTYNDYLGEHSA